MHLRRIQAQFLKEIIAFHALPKAMKQERIEAGAAGVHVKISYVSGCSKLHPRSMEFYYNGYNNKLFCKADIIIF